GNVIACFDAVTHSGSATACSAESGRSPRAAIFPYTTLFRSGSAVGIYTAYAAAKIDATSCESATRTTVTVTINALPGAPSAGNRMDEYNADVQSGGQTACRLEREDWYDAASGGSVTTAATGN